MAHIITSLDPVTAVAIDETGSVTYIGLAKVGTSTAAARWQIRRITQNGNVTLFDFADGNDRYDNIWDNRAALSYS